MTESGLEERYDAVVLATHRWVVLHLVHAVHFASYYYDWWRIMEKAE